jgi:DNA polymerase-3 subunit epsilon
MTFSVIDVETTGLSAKTGDRILEVGIVKLGEDGTITDTMDTLVNPGRRVQATHIHGITDKMVSDAPDFRDIVPHLCGVLDGTVVAAHNASFDLGFLREEFRRAGTSLPFIAPVCTLVLARKFLKNLPSRSLSSCRSYLNLPDEGAHNALADARAAANLLKYFLGEFAPELDVKPFVSALPDYRGGLFDDPPGLKSRGGVIQ